MIDTVRFALSGGVNQWNSGEIAQGWIEKASHSIELPDRGGSKAEQAIDAACGSERWTRFFQHTESAMRVFGDSKEAHYFEVSIPRMFYGQNGIELRPEHFGPADDKMRSLLHQVAPCAKIERLTRVDLVKNFHASAEQWIAMFRGIAHPKVRSRQREWFGTGLTWPGSRLYINLYDKGAEIGHSPGKVMRLEFQMRGRECPREIWTESAGFDFARAYLWYRSLVSGFEPRPVPNIGGLAEFLAWLQNSGVIVEGLRPVDVYLMQKKRARRYGLEREIRAAMVQYQRIEWEQLLPAESAPEWVDCVEPETESEVA